MAKTVLFIFEGEKTENQVHEIFERHYFSDKHVSIKIAFGAEIYQLWRQMTSEDFLDVLEVLKERRLANQEEVAALRRDDISEIYLFFDYDGHTSTASDADLLRMLEYFNEETEAGKLYISYPMAEAVRHINMVDDYLDTVFDISDGKRYKELVNEKTGFMHLAKLEKGELDYVVAQNCKKANYIVHDDRAFPEYQIVINRLSQVNIFNAQLEKHISKAGQVSVLSGFPLFTIEYFGEAALAALHEAIEVQPLR
ncbi:hypothetical protein [Polynucleobacter sp. MWH-Braz-FAM2G]|uniref:hypothetical protein n=1 Tax=Polynucleobacter sp. MWH-Braz-FAM2G TaxID=1855883 RepID=UPI001BFE95C6|nr:hypothetical protein [Polynucleobacter sp. MWH-Braz-FAM2G]QWD91660.1 hypothetical protein FD973_04845 [Polynucleobacter sp. MWH-Braz-FAM2G]